MIASDLDRPRLAKADIGRGGPDGLPGMVRAAAFFEPGFDLFEVPHHAARGEAEPPRKVAPLFHLVDGAVGERNDEAQFVAPDGPG